MYQNNDRLSFQEVMDILNVSQTYVIKQIKNGQLVASRFGGDCFFERAKVMYHLKVSRQKSELALSELAKLSQELGL
jgi:hypothetical protein